MAIKFFDDISLDKQEIQSVALENLAGNPSTPTSGQIYFNTATDAIRYYDGAAWIELDGSGNVDSVTATNGLKNVGTPSAVNIQPDYTSSANIVLSAAGTDALVAASKVLVTVDDIVGPYSLTDLGAVINPLGVSTFTNVNGTFISAGTENTAAIGAVTMGIIDLSATGTPGNTTFLRGDNVWATPAGSYTSWSLEGDSGTAVNITDGLRVDFTGGTGIDTTVASATPNTLTIDLANTTVTAASYTNADITVDAQGRITAAANGTSTDTTYTLPVAAGAANTAQLVLTPSSGGAGGNTITISGTTNEIAITETTGTSGIITIGLPDDVTIANDLTVTGDMSAVAGTFTGNVIGTTATFSGQVTIPQVPTAAGSAASKAYVDGLVVGGLNFKGAYNANTNSPALEGASNIASTKGDTYVVDTDGTFIGEQVRVGDVIIVNEDIAPNSDPALSKFTVVQANTDLATNTTVGLASFPTTNGFASMSNGAAILSAGAQVTTLGSASETVTLTTDAFGKVTTATEQNISITASQVSNFNTTVEGLIDGYRFTSAAFGGSTTATINHSLGSVNVLVQVFLVSDGTTIFAKTARTDANNVTLTFSTAPAAASMKCVIVKCD